MRRMGGLLLLLAAAGYAILHNFNIEGLEQIRLIPRDQPRATPVDAGGQPLPPPIVRSDNAIRIASFNIQVFGVDKLSKPRVMNVLADIVRRFDVVAIQEIRATSNDIIPRFVELINSTGRRYDFIVGPRLGRTSSKEQYAFVYDTASIEVDAHSTYTIDDPQDMLHREPLVAWFRVRGPSPTEAFTFTLVNIHTDPDETKTEVEALSYAYTAVRDDGRGEDDTILLGDLNVNDRQLGRLGALPGMAAAIVGTPTNTRGNQQYDNVLFTMPATSEFSGRAGVFDMVREYNLTVDEALEVSDHLPVWAEFSIYEGGQPGGRFAKRPQGDVSGLR
jgi:endonuclease/exonuclease/phosphatase family metal-dependent hydrolase